MLKTCKPALIAAACAWLGACAGTQFPADSRETMSESKREAKDSSPGFVPAPAEGLGSLKITDLALGKGAEAQPGMRLSVHYTGRLLAGKKFDSSLDRGQPFSFTLGENRVIKGWEQGLVGMKVGGKRQLVIPPHLGYGDAGAPPVIPPKATLVFDIELLGAE